MKKNVTDNKTFWKTIKPILSDKIATKKKMKENEIVSNDEDTAQVFQTL